jgi:hypothetical protein
MKRKRFFSGANCGHREAGGNGDAGGRADPAGRDQRTDVLSLEEAMSSVSHRQMNSQLNSFVSLDRASLLFAEARGALIRAGPP